MRLFHIGRVGDRMRRCRCLSLKNETMEKEKKR